MDLAIISPPKRRLPISTAIAQEEKNKSLMGRKLRLSAAGYAAFLPTD